MNRWFSKIAVRATEAAGSAVAFIIAAVVVVVWAAIGFVVGFTDTHQLVINTGTTIVTFLMVFLLQHTQSSDTRAVHIKLDELIHSIEKANDAVAGIEQKPEEPDDPQVP